MPVDEDPRTSLVPEAFCARIAVFSSPETDEACKRNRLPHFAALLKPFQAVEKVSVRHSTYATVLRPVFPLSFVTAQQFRDEVNGFGREDDLVWIDREVNDVLGPTRLSTASPSHPALPKTSGPIKLKHEHEWPSPSTSPTSEASSSTPWYNAFLTKVLSRRLPTPHDTTTHPLAALLVVSTNEPEPLNEFARLYEASSKSGPGWPSDLPWLDTEPVLRYYVVLHEVSDEADGGKGSAGELLQAVARAYGIHCALVCVNSEGTDYLSRQRKLSTDPHFKYDDQSRIDQFPRNDYWKLYMEQFPPINEGERFGELMAHEDVLAIKIFLREFTIQSLIPHLERCVQHWNESLAASRKGITGRLFSVGLKYFGTSSPKAGSETSSYNPMKRWYSHQSTEFQTRRLADWAFILADYKLSSQTYAYHRKDSQNDKAWTHYASSTYMIGLCKLLQVGQGQRILPDLHEYLFDYSVGGEVGMFERIKMTLIYNEVVRSIGNSNSMSISLLRTASLLDDATAGLIYEQAVTTLPPRRALLYLLLASRCYELSGHRKLSSLMLQRCVGAAGGWRKVEEYVQEGLGRQASNDGRWDIAVGFEWALVRRKVLQGHDEGGVGGAGCLENLRAAFQKLDVGMYSSLKLDEMEGKLVDVLRTKIRIPQQQHLVFNHKIWDRLREEVSVLTGLTDLKHKNTAVVNLPFFVDLVVKNPLGAKLRMSEIELKVSSALKEKAEEANEGVVIIEPIPDLELSPNEERIVPVRITCSEVGQNLKVSELGYKFDGMIYQSQSLAKKGPRLNNTLPERLSKVYGRDTSMDVEVGPDGARIELSGMNELPVEVLAGESMLKQIEVKNVGLVGLHGLRCVVSHQSYFRIGEVGEEVKSIYSTQKVSESGTTQTKIEMPNDLINHPLIPICEELRPSESITVPVFCRGEMVGRHTTFWLFVFQDVESGEWSSLRHVQVLTVLSSLQIKPIIRRNLATDGFYTLTMEIVNEGVSEDLEVYQITTIGTHWKSEALVGSAMAPLKLTSGSQATAALKFEPFLDTERKDEATPFVLHQLELLLAKKDLVNTVVPGPVTSCVSNSVYDKEVVQIDEQGLLKIILSSHRSLRAGALGRQFTAISTRLLPYLFPLTVPRSVDLIVFWRTSSGKKGHHHIADLLLGATGNVISPVLQTIEGKAGGIYAESQAQQRKLIDEWSKSEFGRFDKYQVDVQVRPVGGLYQDWDFGRLGPMRLKVQFELKNLGMANSVQFKLVLRRDKDSIEESQGQGQEIGPTEWVGPTVYKGFIEALGRVLVEAEIWIVSEGLMHVGRWVCEAWGGEKDFWRILGDRTLVSVRDLETK